MILIVSVENDRSTTEIITWFKHWKVPYLRINRENQVHLIKISFPDEIIIEVNGYKVNLHEISTLWYRRGSFNFHRNFNEIIKQVVQNESRVINDYIFNFFKERAFCLNNFLYSQVNKLRVLAMAQKLGLEIPETLISGSKDVTSEFLFKHSPVITKSIGASFSVGEGETAQAGYTEQISQADLYHQDDVYFPSLLQNQIKKRYEVRSFYLKGQFFSMAILSQNNPKTMVDFRKYDSEKPNRALPFQLPSNIENKLRFLFNDLNLNCGSADFIVDEYLQFIFLEINPIGQFSMVSKPCNYNLEREIARVLSNHGKENRDATC